ncbi:MAG: metallophosphoesterase [Anaerolineae bacterium]|nr:metallophosphoesterase [Anaerolineae bacterium]
MPVYAHRFVHSLFSLCPGELVLSVALVSLGGVAAGAGILSLQNRQQEIRRLLAAGLPLSAALLAFCLGDWALLWALPHLRISFSTEIMLPLVASFFVRLLVFWGLLGAMLLAQQREKCRWTPGRATMILFFAANLGFSAVQVDAYAVEPLLVETTELSLAFDDLDPAAPPLRVVQITDTHIERSGHREATVVRQVNALQPDIILLTGDYLNLSCLDDPTSAAHFRQFIAQLQAPYGIYAVRGSVEPMRESMASLIEGTDIVWLEQEAVTLNVRGQAVTLVGVDCSHNLELDTARLEQALEGVPADAFTLLLYHSPDLIHEASAQQVDLYLGGHTHGGQICLPFYGALVTASIYGKQYESGLFQKGETTMYISRGLGFEGGGMPRARFLCRPEVVAIELTAAR